MSWFSFTHKKKYLTYYKDGILVTLSTNESIVVDWKKIEKIVFVSVFEEYSGYFLTNDYKSKVLYNNISIDCRQNIVRIRTGRAPTTKKNTSEPFSRKFGTTSIYHVVFVEYIDELENKNLYGIHYNNDDKNELINTFKIFLNKDKIHEQKMIEGFTPLSQL
ncbi:hypothetical protein [Wenyingzhuangia sp. IMCC45467]